MKEQQTRRFRRFAVMTVVATYLLIFVGGLVRVSGAGLGCPDWPMCFGRWIPPTNVSQLPATMDASLFNFTLAWIEYINRLIGVAIGFLIFITATLAFMHFRRVKRILYPSIIALLLVAYQGWQGSQVVASGLEPFIITIHMVLAFIIVSLLIYVAQQAYYLEHPRVEAQSHYPPETKKLIVGLWAVVIVQIILGTQVRSLLSVAAEKFPFFSDGQLLNAADPISYLHGLLGVAVAGLTWYTGQRILKRSQSPSPLVEYGAKIMIFLVAAQIAIGGVLVGLHLPDLMQLYHLWIASLFTGVLLVLYSAVQQKVKRYES